MKNTICTRGKSRRGPPCPSTLGSPQAPEPQAKGSYNPSLNSRPHPIPVVFRNLQLLPIDTNRNRLRSIPFSLPIAPVGLCSIVLRASEFHNLVQTYFRYNVS